MDAATDTPSLSERDLLQAGFRYGMALAHSVEDAEDLVQEAWLNLTRRYGAVGSRAVLFTTVRNLFIDQCRRRKIVHFESIDQPDPPNLPPLAVEEPGLQGDLAAMLALLRPAEREALFLHYYEGRTAEEISQLTGQPRGTVLSLMHRAIIRLREAANGPAASTGGNQWLRLLVSFM
jgi:RNA polymerase sigma-70 factor (ECF subfamily)